VSYSELMQAYPALALGGVTLLGLIVGSFLNVVILRQPEIMRRQWQRECRELLAEGCEGAAAGDEASDPREDAADEERFSLAFPASHCPKCQAPIAPWHNIPVLSYVLLRGRCAACKAPIAIRYPLVELLSGFAAIAVAAHAGSWLELSALLLFTWALLALAGIDWDTQFLPDDITLPLLWGGLLYNLSFGSVPIADAVIGAAAGYLLLWSIYWAFRLLTGKEGMGYGDFKLLAALGAWLGWQSIPLIILLSSAVGAVIGILLIVLKGRDRSHPMPFGPYLAAAGWIAALWGGQLSGLLQIAPP
jgi:leader peptidase (prepilin peptidase)/N-methyltransferase